MIQLKILANYLNINITKNRKRNNKTILCYKLLLFIYIICLNIHINIYKYLRKTN